MPALGILWQSLLLMLKPLLRMALRWLGVAFVSFTGGQLVSGIALDYVKGHFAGLPSRMAAILGLMHFDTALALVFSAFALKLAKTYINGMERHPVWRAPDGGDGLPGWGQGTVGSGKWEDYIT